MAGVQIQRLEVGDLSKRTMKGLQNLGLVAGKQDWRPAMPGKLTGCCSTGTEGCCCSGTGDSCSSGTDEHCNSGTDKRCNSGTDECCCLGSTGCCSIELQTAAAQEMGSMLGCRLEAGNLGLDDRRLRSRLTAGKLGLNVGRMKAS